MGLKMHAVSLVASIIFHACVRNRTDWACCQSKTADMTDYLQHLVPLLQNQCQNYFWNFENPSVSGRRILVISPESFLKV
jgi:hypothetical protein